MENLRPLYQECLTKWGLASQLDMATEECAELIQAISHLRRGRIQVEKLAEEIADVELMVAQLRFIFGDDTIDKAKELKVAEIRRRLDT